MQGVKALTTLIFCKTCKVIWTLPAEYFIDIFLNIKTIISLILSTWMIDLLYRFSVISAQFIRAWFDTQKCRVAKKYN